MSHASLSHKILDWCGLPRFWLICIFGLALRVLFLIVFLSHTRELNYGELKGSTYHEAGVDGYLQIASTLLRTGEYSFEPGGVPVSFRPPLQVALMAVFGAWSENYWHYVWFAGALAIWVATLYCSGKVLDLFKVSPLWKNWALLIIAVHPYAIFTIKTPGLVVLLTLIATLFFYAWLMFLEVRSFRSALCLGLVCGLACLTHGVFLPLCVVMAAVAIQLGVSIGMMMLRRLALAAAVAVLLVSPWTLRNFLEFDKFIPVATGGAFQYWIADRAYFNSYKPVGQIILELAQDYQHETGEALQLAHWGIMDPRQEEWFARKAADQIRGKPWILAQRLAMGIYSFWAPIDRGWKKSVQLGLLNVPLLGIAGLLMLLTARRKHFCENDIIPAAFLLSYMFIFVFIQAISGYFIAIIPSMICWMALLVSRSKTAW